MSSPVLPRRGGAVDWGGGKQPPQRDRHHAQLSRCAADYVDGVACGDVSRRGRGGDGANPGWRGGGCRRGAPGGTPGGAPPQSAPVSLERGTPARVERWLVLSR